MAEARSSDRIERLENEVSHLKGVLVDGNGHSLVTRVALIEAEMPAIKTQCKSESDAIRRELRIGVAVSTTILSIVISIWKVFGG